MLEFRILGPLEVCWDGEPLRLPGIASRRVLAALVVDRGTWLSADRLIDELWSERAPPSARKALQMHVARLRRSLSIADTTAGSVLTSGSAGYRLEIDAEQLDAARFERLVVRAQDALATCDPGHARDLLLEALGLWRGEPLAELSPEGATAIDVARLEELRLVALESRMEADLQLGRHHELIGELQALVREHGSRERLHGQLMLALYRAGRQVDALDAYRAARSALVEQFGLEPGPELRELEQAILRQDPSLQLVEAPPPPQPGVAQRAASLPAPTTRLIGRDREVGELAGLLLRDDVRLVTIVGAGGVGKTRLALELADSLGSQLDDGSHWIELAAVVRPEHVASAIANALGAEPVTGESTEGALIRRLEPRRALVVIDNFEQVLDAAPLIGELLRACRRLTVLATSRQALELGAEHQYPLAPLAVPRVPEEATENEIRTIDATALFLDAAARHGARLRVTATNAPAIAAICARLDGLPLALELAAARSALLGPDELAARLAKALSALGHGPRDAPDRQQTLRATIDWSYRLLDPAEQAAFARFACFSGGAPVDAAEAIIAAPLDALEGLVAKHLLFRLHAEEEPRLAMLETVRAYALERLEDDPESGAVRARHCEYYLRLVAHGAPDLLPDVTPEWLSRVDREIDNLRSALAWASANETDAALHLARYLGEYWLRRGSIDEGLRSLDETLDAAGPHAPVQAVAHLRSLGSYLLYRTDDLDACQESARLSLALSRAAGDDMLMSHAWGHLVASAQRRHKPAEAVVHGRAALRHARRAGDDALLAPALAMLAPSLPSREGQPLYEEAVEVLHRVGNRHQLCMLHGNMGVRATIEGRYDDALALSAVALPLARADGDPHLIQALYHDVGLAELFSGRYEAAEAAFAEQLRMCRRYGFRWPASEGLLGMAAIAAARGDHLGAAGLLGASRAASKSYTHVVEDRLEELFFAPARAAAEDAVWRAAHEAGALLAFDDAIHEALPGRDPRPATSTATRP